MTDISADLVNPDYLGGAAPNDFFYVWFNLDSGAIELSFANNNTVTAPTQIGRLIYQMYWYKAGYGTGKTSYTTTVTGSGNENEPSGGNVGNGTGGLNNGYNVIVGVVEFTSEVAEPKPDLVIESCWSQNGGVTKGSVDHFNNGVTTTSYLMPGGNQSWYLDLNNAPTGKYDITNDTAWESGLYKVTIQNVGFIFEKATPVCFHRDSLISTKNQITEEIEFKLAKNVTIKDEVFSTTQNKFVPVRLNIITFNNKEYIVFKKDVFEENKPCQDLYITGGHPILYNGNETRTMDIPSIDKINVDPEEVYSIATDLREYILVNNVETLTWSYEAWRNLVLRNKSIIWNETSGNIIIEQNDIKLIGDDSVEPKNIFIKKGACGENVPEIDTIVNQNYKILIDKKESTIEQLLNGQSINWI